MRNVRIGGVVGALAAIGLVVAAAGIPPFDPVVIALLCLLALCGWGLGASAVHAWYNVRARPSLLARVAAVLGVLSLGFLYPTYQEWRRATAFMASADSTYGRVIRRYVRGGVHLTVKYTTDLGTHTVVQLASPEQESLQEGDSLTVYFPPDAEWQGELGRPGPDWTARAKHLAIAWGVGGIMLAGYGHKAVTWATSYQRGRWSAT